MKPVVLISFLLLPLVSCSSTAPKTATAASTSAAPEASAHGKKGRHHHKAAETTTPAATASSGAVKPYPLKTCLVTGDKLDPNDEIITTTYKGQEIKLCCRKCLASFKKNPEKYMAKLKN